MNSPTYPFLNDGNGYNNAFSDYYGNVKPTFKVVIDAGHGGKDPGTLGANNMEKDIALSIALGTGALIKKLHPDVEVVYTRTKDVFIPLHERIGIANSENADLFISIHCNATANTKVSGTETFVMGLHKAEENIETAKRENSAILLESDFEENYEGFDPNSDAGHIILSMYQNTYLDQSIEFANLIENTMNIKTSRGVKQAGFVVLKRATMPSVLIETGFLSNESDEARLSSSRGQEEICESIAKAFSKYKSLKSSEQQHIASNKTIEPEMFYSIQLMAFSQEKNIEFFSNVPALYCKKEKGLFKYCSGRYTDRQKAMQAKLELNNLGYKDAFIITLDHFDGSFVQN